MDIQGPSAVAPYAQKHSFVTVIDRDNQLGAHFGLTIVPNGILLDEEGKIRLLKQGFHVDNPQHTEGVLRWLRGEIQDLTFDDVYYEPPSQEDALKKELAVTKMKLAQMYQSQGQSEAALRELDGALLLDTDNFLIRKQRWYIRHPEKFSPEIDIEWQKAQLKDERAMEAAKLEGDTCGPEGCRIPGT